VPLSSLPPLPLDHRKVIARRALQELRRGDVVNLGVGMADGIAAVAAEEGCQDDIILTIEQGLVGGIPALGVIFGVSFNPEAILDQPAQFDFYDGGGLDITFLGCAQVDRDGNVNVSKFGPRLVGTGGFVNISQNAGTVVFLGTFTSGGLQTQVGDGAIGIMAEGRHRKFVERVDQITFSAAEARRRGQRVLYVTERAVFQLGDEGLELIEVAPGIDLETDVLAHMDFAPRVARADAMPERVFWKGPMGWVLPDQADEGAGMNALTH
jgi:acyl CoA:acetate/3-ketoacid CoA transferase